MNKKQMLSPYYTARGVTPHLWHLQRPVNRIYLTSLSTTEKEIGRVFTGYGELETG